MVYLFITTEQIFPLQLQPCKVCGYRVKAKLNNTVQCTYSVHMLSCLYATSGASLASVEDWRVEYFCGNIKHTHTSPTSDKIATLQSRWGLGYHYRVKAKLNKSVHSVYTLSSVCTTLVVPASVEVW
jgi:hypothetical protein